MFRAMQRKHGRVSLLLRSAAITVDYRAFFACLTFLAARSQAVDCGFMKVSAAVIKTLRNCAETVAGHCDKPLRMQVAMESLLARSNELLLRPASFIGATKG
jgi:hypothetical protein